MKKLSLLTMIAAIAGMRLVTAVIWAAGNFPPVEQIDPSHLAALKTGKFHVLFEFLPVAKGTISTPSAATLAGIDSTIMMSVLVGVVFFALRLKLRQSLLVVGWVCLLLWIVPYAMSLAALRNNTDLNQVGHWLTLVLRSALFSCVACFVFAGLQYGFAPNRKKHPANKIAMTPAGAPIIEYPL